MSTQVLSLDEQRRRYIADAFYSDEHELTCPYWYGREDAVRDEKDCICEIGTRLHQYEMEVRYAWGGG